MSERDRIAVAVEAQIRQLRGVPSGVLSFDRDTPDFARGVEVGMAWARLATESRPVTMLVHGDNAEMVLRMAEARDVRATAVDLGGDWLEVTYDEHADAEA